MMRNTGGIVVDEALTEGQLARAHVRVPDHVVYRAFDAETVLLNLETGTYHGLNETGGRVLEVLRETGSTVAAAEAVAAEFAQPVEEVTRDVVELCQVLASRGLIEVSAADI